MGLSDNAELILTVGGTWEGVATPKNELGEPALDSTWRGRLVVRDRLEGAEIIFTLAESGADGTLTITSDGHVVMFLPSTHTAGLTPTSDSVGRNSSQYVGQFSFWRASQPTVVYKPEALVSVFVRPEVAPA